jgi:large subunit ribosomal protein L5
MNRLRQKYNKEVVPAMKEKFGYRNNLAVPKIEKVTLNVGISATKRDEKFTALVEKTLTRISGQKPVFTKAKKSIASFKVREGQVVGAKVTLRRERMYDFLDKLINVALPRVRDFRGLSLKSVDKNGNLTIGFKEHLVFGEISMDEVEMIHGLEIIITTNAKNREKGMELLKLIGIPFQK